jgi:hypothetical protein
MISFPLLSDADGSVIESFGVRNREARGILPHPGFFIVDREGVIRAKLAFEGYKKRHGAADIIQSVRDLEKPRQKTDDSENEDQDEDNDKAALIGVYDSRAVAIAFVGSEIYKSTAGRVLAAKMDEYEKAKELGDTKRIAELEAWGRSQQAILHRQGFSTAPVDSILAHIPEQLREIKDKNGIDYLISKWDHQSLEKYSNVVKQDVTLLLIDAFRPNAQQKKSAMEIQKTDPVPLRQLEIPE